MTGRLGIGIATGTQTAVLRGREHSWDNPVFGMNSAAFSPDGSRIVTASEDQTARIWNPVSGKVIATLGGHWDRVLSAAFSPDGSRMVSASWDKTLRIWDAKTGKYVLTLHGHTRMRCAARGRPTGRAWSRRLGTIRCGSGTPKPEEIASSAPGHERCALRVVARRGAPRLGVFRQYAADLGRQNRRLTLLRVTDMRCAARGQPRRGAPGLGVLRQDAADLGRQNRRRKSVLSPGHDDPCALRVVSPDGARMVSASSDKTARIWDAATAKNPSLRGHTNGVGCAWSPRRGAPGLGVLRQYARIWDAATAKEIAVLRGHEDHVSSAAFSPDGSRIATASEDKTARICDAATAEEIAVLRGHENIVWSAAFSPDGSRIVTASGDRTARIWDAATATEIAVLRGRYEQVVSAAFSPDGSRIVTASGDRTARIWDVRFATMPAKDLVAEVCTRRLRGVTKLTREEMRLAGYPDSTPEIDVCAGIE